MSDSFGGVPREVIVIPQAADQASPGLLGALRGAAEAAAQVAMAMGEVAQSAVVAIAGPPTNAVLDRVVPAVTDAILQRLNITGIVIERVDLRVIVVTVLDRLDLTDVVIGRVDLARVVDAALDEVDLTQIVLERVDLQRIVANVELDPILDRVPIVELADYVIEQVDLPQIIRQSTGGVAADAIDAARMASYRTDVGVARFVDRLVFRRRRALDAPGDPESLADEESTP
ncbi:MAG: hypothetical protein ACKOMX_09165 [Actinomycetota bacterium]